MTGGLGRSLPPILLLVLMSAFVGGMVGIERTVVPLLGEAEFGISSHLAALSFIATFGVAKALLNFAAGVLSEGWGRRRVLILGWLAGAPVPLLLMHAGAWEWVLAANVLLGANQALTWSMTVSMKVDLAPSRSWGLVIGWNEFAGYAGMAATAALTGYLAAVHGPRPVPFYAGVGLAAAGLLLSIWIRETRPGRTGNAPEDAATGGKEPVSLLRVLVRTTTGDPRLSGACLGGLVTNLKDGVLWGLLPILLVARGSSLRQVALITSLYPAVWAISQLVFGPLSDRSGRRPLIVGGLLLQGAGVAGFAVAGGVFPAHLVAAGLAGLGTGMAYPVLLALVSESAPSSWRASALGIYRAWRDLGYAVGAVGAGMLADALGITMALAGAAALTAATAAVVTLRTR